MLSMAEPKIRGIHKDFEAWMSQRREFLEATRQGLNNGDFASPLELDSSKDPDPAGIQAEIWEIYTVLGQGTKIDYPLGAYPQLHLLEAAKRTAAVVRVSRADALARLLGELEDGTRRDLQLETLVLNNDAPEGIPPKTEEATV